MILFYCDSIGIDKQGIVAIHALSLDNAFLLLNNYLLYNSEYKIFNVISIVQVAPFNTCLKKQEIIIVDSGEN